MRGFRPVLHVMLVAATAALGCQDTNKVQRYAVSGSVTLEGQPITAGRIIFYPDTRRGQTGPIGFATIEQGRYDTEKGGRGTVGGPHIARIRSVSGDMADETMIDSVERRELAQPVDLPHEDTVYDFTLTYTPR